MPDWKENINFVLVEPVESGNIGSSARAMKAMGFERLRLVNSPEKLGPEATWMSHYAEDVVRRAKRFSSLPEAIEDAVLVIGLTRRTGKDRGSFLHIEDAVRKVVETARSGPVSLLFGREDRGLFNEEADECAWLVSIPAGGEHTSLNLSHAVQIIAYELHKSALALPGGSHLLTGSGTPPTEPLATQGKQGFLFERIVELLEELNYTKQGDRELGKKIRMMLKHFLNRAGLTERELHMLEGICARILSRLGKM
jgi:TrmH family RNA methyltransferase